MPICSVTVWSQPSFKHESWLGEDLGMPQFIPNIHPFIHESTHLSVYTQPANQPVNLPGTVSESLLCIRLSASTKCTQHYEASSSLQDLGKHEFKNYPRISSIFWVVSGWSRSKKTWLHNWPKLFYYTIHSVCSFTQMTIIRKCLGSIYGKVDMIWIFP